MQEWHNLTRIGTLIFHEREYLAAYFDCAIRKSNALIDVYNSLW
jgi:hypothetical protein